MVAARLAALLVCACLTHLVAPLALAAPRCTKTCRKESARCATTRCATLRGKARQACLETCRGIGGCAPIRTLAYVVSTCTAGVGFHQKLQIRHGDCDPVTVLDFPEPVAVPPSICAVIGSARSGYATGSLLGAFQRMGVSPDGRHVVFEVTDDFSLVGAPLPPGQQKGIFVVRVDGRGVRRLSPASRDPSFRFAVEPASPYGFRGKAFPFLGFSPDGRAVVLTDLGPGPGGEEAVQIFTLDLVTRTRQQLTHLPLVADHPEGAILLNPGTCCPFVLANGRIVFLSYGNLDGSNPDGNQVEFVMNRDGSGLKRVPLPVAAPAGQVIPNFGITGAGVRTSVDTLLVPGMAVNPLFADNRISEVFLIDGTNLVQLTNFRRHDTFAVTLTGDGQRALFTASADPLHTNPSGDCQLFSIDTHGAGLRQLTHFSQPAYSVNGCDAFAGPGCYIVPLGLDPATGTLVFDSQCDPFGTNPDGDQLFAIREDGTRLRQLTHARGFVTEPDGTVSAENIGPWGYQPLRGVNGLGTD